MKIMIYAQELLSVALTPFVLWFSLPDCAPAIVDFFREFTIHVDTLGYVCSFAVFDFRRHGNVKVSLSLISVSPSSIGTGLFPLVDHYPKIYDFPLDLWGMHSAVLMGWVAIDGLMEEMGKLPVPEKLLRLLLPSVF
jgi:hypothetical protein